MRFIKRAIVILLLLTAVGILFRGWLYRHLITYKSVGARTNYVVTDNKLVEYIDANTDNQANPAIEEVIKNALSITSKQLNFTGNKNNVDPNKLIHSKAAHCVGYAAFFATTCNHLLAKRELAGTWTAKPQVGQLYFLGTNIHQHLKSPFFKDHDFVTIENRKTGKLFAVDPTVNDYFFIDFVAHLEQRLNKSSR